MARKPPRRRCKGKTRAGKRCKAPPPKGLAYCRAHDPQVPASARFGSPEQAAAAARGVERRVPRATELLREWAEQNAELIVAVLFDALTASRGVTIRMGGGKDTLVETPDHGTRLAAARELLDRVDGKPRQVTEIAGTDGGPIHVSEEAFADPATRKAMHELVKRVGAARSVGTGRARARD